MSKENIITGGCMQIKPIMGAVVRHPFLYGADKVDTFLSMIVDSEGRYLYDSTNRFIVADIELVEGDFIPIRLPSPIRGGAVCMKAVSGKSIRHPWLSGGENLFTVTPEYLWLDEYDRGKIYVVTNKEWIIN
jgi:hypothetical protein